MRITLFSPVVCALLVAAVFADTVTLKNEYRLTGAAFSFLATCNV